MEDTKGRIETYMSKASELRYYELIKYILPGRYRPFGSTDEVSDIPTEYVGNSQQPVVNDYEDTGLQEGDEASVMDDPSAAIQRDLQDQNLRRNRLKTSKK